ncbi:MAG: family 20 glycosylhydrolase [Chitinophagaceae bacterium]|nr:family 20 glycosylhydrolase [Chitinophagaceae bacterium]
MRKHAARTLTLGFLSRLRHSAKMASLSLSLLLSITAAAAPAPPTLPILPAPRYARQLTPSFHLSLSPDARWTGLDTSALHRLQIHWRALTKGTGQNAKGQQVHLGLLGKDPDFDRAVAFAMQPIPSPGSTLAPTWTDSLGKEGYLLALQHNTVLIAARTETGLFYGLQSLRQLARSKWDHELLIADWPAFAFRGIFDDISRGPISTVAYIKQQIQRMAEIKINYLSFYIEHVVQPLSHPDFAPADGKLTIAEIKELSAYAASFHMQLIGSFQSFGHFEKILSQPRYASLGATNTLINPSDPKAQKFLADVIGELCDAFSAPWFNVNCDETFDLGQGLTKPYVDTLGPAAFYAGHLKFLNQVVRSHGKSMMMWGDFLLQHPETFDLLPPDITYLTWEYGNQPSYDDWIKPFAGRHLPFLICPGILNTYRLFPDMTMARANIEGFARQGLRDGAQGILTTVWDDGSAYLFSADWYGIYVTAEAGWSAAPSPTFNQRYASTAYGPMDGSYVQSMETLMRLKKLPLTYNLSEGPWRAKLIPDSGKKLILNNASAGQALQIIQQAQRQLGTHFPQRNAGDIRTLSYTLQQYRLLLISRLHIADIARDYRKSTTAAPQQAAALLTRDIAIIDTLKKEYTRLRSWFRSAWLAEDQPYWLDIAQQPYDKRIDALTQLAKSLTQAREKTLAHTAMPTPASIGLDIRESSFDYFQGWMLAGPFATKDTSFPGFLYAEDTAYDHPPTPGDFTRWQGRLYRWKKYASEAGGIIDLDATFDRTKGDAIYAYCLINSDTAVTLRAYMTHDGRTTLFCNGKEIVQHLTTTDEKGFTLPLQPGANHILIKLGKDPVQPWTFTFRLQENTLFTNHKFKYQLNGKNKLYAAD